MPFGAHKNWHESELLTVLPIGHSSLPWECKNCHRRLEGYKGFSAIRNSSSSAGR